MSVGEMVPPEHVAPAFQEQCPVPLLIVFDSPGNVFAVGNSFKVNHYRPGLLDHSPAERSGAESQVGVLVVGRCELRIKSRRLLP